MASVIFKTEELTTLPESGEKYVIYIVGTSLYIWDGTQFVNIGGIDDLFLTVPCTYSGTWEDCIFGEAKEVESPAIQIPTGYKYMGIIESYMDDNSCFRVILNSVHMIYHNAVYKLKFTMFAMDDDMTFNFAATAKILYMKDL
mgnify:CR=1 FL=1